MVFREMNHQGKYNQQSLQPLSLFEQVCWISLMEFSWLVFDLLRSLDRLKELAALTAFFIHIHARLYLYTYNLIRGNA